MNRSPKWQPRGVLQPALAAEKFSLVRLPPAPAVADLIERYWLITWDLRGQSPHRAETLPQPYVNLVFEAHQARLYGVTSQKYTNCLVEQGRVFGIKFKPGALYPLLRQPMTAFTDRAVPIERCFGAAGTELWQAILDQEEPMVLCQLADAFWAARLPAPDATVQLIGAIVNHMMTDRTVLKVAAVAYHFGMSRRTLQRLFSRYVGVSPKWVITRYRLHDAAEQLLGGTAQSLATMAQDLGYFDQAHFIKEFKAVVGVSPAEYARTVELSI